MGGGERRPKDLDLFVAVAIGGMIGACARHAMDLLIITPDDQWPMATFIVNLTGALILGIVIEAATAIAPDPGASSFARRLRPFLITGVLGGYTTFSTYMVEAHGLALAGQSPMAAFYIFGSMVLGVLLVILGMALGKALFKGARIRSAAADEIDELTQDEA